MDVIAPFWNHLPVKIRFGDGVVAQLADVLAGEGATHAFVVIDDAVQAIPQLAAALAAIEDGGGSVTRWVKAPSEPTIAEVEDAAARLAASGADAIVAIGGGSSMDVAKTARLVAAQGGPYAKYAAGGQSYLPPRIPLVCIPTTAGTGSEVSGGAVITDQESDRKAGIANPLLRAQHALVDAELTHGLPAKPTLYAGVDALAQAIAAVAVVARTPIGNAVALEATRLAAAALPAVVRDGSDRGARSQMMCASLLAGLCMNIADCGSEHSIAQSIGGRFHLPHGLTIGLVLAETMEHDRHGAPELFERIADALGEPPDATGDGSRAVRGVHRLLAEVDFPTLGSVGVREADLDALAEDALADHFISVAPVPWRKEDVVACYREALAITVR